MRHMIVCLMSLLILGLTCGALRAEQQQNQVQRTLSIIKPDAVSQNRVGKIITKLEAGGLKVIALKMVKLNLEQAKEFYRVHKDKPFYSALVAYMSSGPIVVQVLEGENAVALNREIMGATDPQKAQPGTIRAEFGTNIQQNAVHGSDSLESAQMEIKFFFKPDEIFSRS